MTKNDIQAYFSSSNTMRPLRNKLKLKYNGYLSRSHALRENERERWISFAGMAKEMRKFLMVDGRGAGIYGGKVFLSFPVCYDRLIGFP